jgi:hypothetical protein
VDIHNLFAGAMAKSGVSRALQGGELASNTAFAAYNQQVQIALNAIKPYRELAEQVLGDICETMCRWIAISPDAIEAVGNKKDDLGKRYAMIPEEINTEDLCITVELKPDVPTDRMERINAASVAHQQLHYSTESGLEDIGVADPQKEIRRDMYERLLENEIQNDIARSQAQVQLEVEEAKLKMQTEAQMAMQQQQMAQQQQMQQQQPVQGPGFNPNSGGTPPAMASPNATREGVTGRTQGGQEVAGA